MEPGQYTGKSDATPPDGRTDDTAQANAGSSPAPTEGPPVRPSLGLGERRTSGDRVRIAIWLAAFAVLVAGVILYFRFERTVVPLVGGGR